MQTGRLQTAVMGRATPPAAHDSCPHLRCDLRGFRTPIRPCPRSQDPRTEGERRPQPSQPEPSLWKTGFSPAARSGPGWARGAAPRWVSAAEDRGSGSGSPGGRRKREEDAGRDFARHDSRRRVGKREGLETEKGVESESLGNKESKEAERGYVGKVMGGKENEGAGEGDEVRKGRIMGRRG